MVTEENPVRKKPLGRLRLGWEDVVGKNVESLNGGSDWKARAVDWDSWRNPTNGCVTGWS